MAGGGCCAATPGSSSAYGAIAVAGAQFCYFSAVQHMQVGPAILIEFTAPAAVVVYLWLRHGQRPGRMTLAGAGLAALGLVLVLDLVSGADLSVPGVLWALGAMVGCATYFIISADEDNGLPPLVLAWVGLLVGALVLGLLGLVGVLPMRASTASPSYADVQSRGGCRWWCWAWSPPRCPTSPASPPVAGSARDWRRSWPCSRWSPASRGRGCSSRAARCSTAGGRPADPGRRGRGKAGQAVGRHHRSRSPA